MKRVLVTGANGFVGRALCAALISKGIDVVAVVRRATNEESLWSEELVWDFSQDIKLNLNLENIDAVYHLANVAHTNLNDDDSHLYKTINMCGTRHLLDALVSQGIKKFIYFSSANVSQIKINEGAILNENSYVGSKLQAESLVRHYGEIYNFDFCILRPALIYGSHIKGNLASLAKLIDKFPIIPVTPDSVKFDMVSLRDTVDLAIVVGESDKLKNAAYLVTDGMGYTLSDVVEYFSLKLNKKIIIIPLPLLFFYFFSKFGDFVKLFFGINISIDSGLYNKIKNTRYPSSEKSLRDDLLWVPKDSLYNSKFKWVRN